MYVHWTRVFDGAGRVEAIEETLQVAMDGSRQSLPLTQLCQTVSTTVAALHPEQSHGCHRRLVGVQAEITAIAAAIATLRVVSASTEAKVSFGLVSRCHAISVLQPLLQLLKLTLDFVCGLLGGWLASVRCDLFIAHPDDGSHADLGCG